MRVKPKRGYVRDRSCLLRCSLLLKALLQNWHLYLRSGASDAFRDEVVAAAGGVRTETLAPGIATTGKGRPRKGWDGKEGSDRYNADLGNN